MSILSGPHNTPHQLFLNGEAGGWWDASDLDTLFSDVEGTTPASVDGVVKRMNDKSGNGNDFAMSLTDRWPYLRQSGNIYYLEFDGSNDGLTANNMSSMGNCDIGAESSTGIAYYLDSTTSSTSGTFLGPDSAGNYGSVWRPGTRLNLMRSYIVVDDGGWVTVFSADLPSMASYTDENIVYQYESYIDATNVNCSAWKGGAFNSSNTQTMLNPGYLPIPHDSIWAMGARAPTNDNWIKGRFYAGYTVNRVLTSDERNTVGRYLDFRANGL